MNLTTPRYGLIALIGLAVTASVLGGVWTTTDTAPEQTDSIEMVTYKSPNCGCCGAWARYSEQQGFDTQVNDVDDIQSVKDEHEVPRDVWSCHTSIVEGYVIEGHVPVEAIEKLLEEEPDIEGIALPGMPSGSPGMPGPKQDEWTIYALHEDGTTSTFMEM